MGFGAKPQASLRSFVGFASCKTSVRTLSSILAWSQGASLSALRLIFKSSAFEPPFSPWGRQARMPEGERPKRIRKMRHRAFTKRQGRLKVSAQSVARRHANKAFTKRQGRLIMNAQRLCTDAKPTKQTTRTPATFCKRWTKTFGSALQHFC